METSGQKKQMQGAVGKKKKAYRAEYCMSWKDHNSLPPGRKVSESTPDAEAA